MQYKPPYSHHADDDQGHIGQHIIKMDYIEEAALIGKVVVIRVLGNRMKAKNGGNSDNYDQRYYFQAWVDVHK